MGNLNLPDFGYLIADRLTAVQPGTNNTFTITITAGMMQMVVAKI